MRVLHLRGCAGSDSSASDDEPGRRPGFRSLSGRSAVFRSRRRGEHGKPVDNPCSRRVRVSGSGPGLTTLPTLPAVGGRSRFGAFHSATALRGFSINDFFWVGPWKCGQSKPGPRHDRKRRKGLSTFPRPHPAAALGPRSVIRFAATTLCGLPSFRSRSANSFKSVLRIEAASAA